MSKEKGKFINAFNNFKVSRFSKGAGIAPAVVVLVALILIISLGVTSGSFTNAVGIGIDFEGGTMLTVTLGEEAVNNYDYHMSRIKTAIEEKGVTVSYIQKQVAGDEDQSSISFRYKNIYSSDEEINALNDQIKDAVAALYADTDIATFNITYESIGSTAASDLLSKAGIALSISTALILIYIIIRFTLVSGVAAVIALLHDVVIMFALTVLCRIQINTSFVAALITIIAYSINNTIVIFDRCREYVKPLKGQKNIDYKGIGDMAVRDTMTRSVYTTLTTMVTVILLAALGSDSLQEFCIPIILGLVAGFYSSVFLAVPMWSAMSYSYDKLKEKRLNRNAAVYEKKSDEGEEEDVTAVRPSPSEGAEEIFGTRPRAVVPKTKPKGKQVYKYSKKNTTFKKK